jgi:capsular polysaccharide transport system permease protein
MKSMKRKTLETLARVRTLVGGSRVPGALKSLARARIFVSSGNSVPAAKPNSAALVGTGTRIVPTVYEKLRDQRRRRRTAMILWMAVPTSIAALYYGLIASDRYVSGMQAVLGNQSESGLGALGGGAGGKPSVLSMLGIGNTDQTSAHAIAANYLESAEAMNAADKAIGLKTMWSAGSIDFLSRLPKDASQETFLKYFQRHVTVIADPAEPVIEVQVAAFSPHDAQLIGKTLMELAQEKLETAHARMREDSLRFAEQEVWKGEERLAKANAELKVFRDTHTDLDPAASAKGVGAVAMGLFAQLESAEARLRALRDVARDDSPPVKSLKSQIEALKSQIAVDRELMASKSGDKSFSSVMSAYEDFMLKQKFAQEAYAAALANLTMKRADLEHRHTYLLDFLSASLPEEATEPHAARNVALVFLASVLTWLTGSLLVAALREHARQ